MQRGDEGFEVGDGRVAFGNGTRVFVDIFEFNRRTGDRCFS